MWNSSSDDDWMKKPAPAPTSGRGESAMMTARRQALQRQREQQQQQQQQQLQPEPAPQQKQATHSAKPKTRSSSNSSASRRPPAAGRLGSQSPPSDASSAEGTSHTHASSKPRPVERKKPLDPAEITENTIADLTRQVEAKKKLLASTREREQVLLDKWRAAKAQKKAEIAQLDAQLRTLWSTVEDAKAASDTRVRDTQDELEKALRTARRDAEAEARAAYEPQIAEAEKQLESLKSEETRLRALLNAQDDTRDLVSSAISSALTTILARIQDVFAESSEDAQKWNEDIKELLRREVRSSFAVSVGSEGQAEREEYQRQFAEMLEFWKVAESEEWERAAKMDDALLSDMQRMAKEDVQRLRNEEQTMEEVYVQSREVWAQEHQKTLYAELQSAVERRREETEAQRQARHRLHVERLQDLERRHAEQTTAEEAIHKFQMQQLRDLLSREEQLQEDRHRAQVAAQEDVAKTTESMQGVVGLLEQVLSSLREYQQEVDQGRAALHHQHAQSVQESVDAVSGIVDLLRQQASSTDNEQRSLHTAATELQIVSDQVEKQLESEGVWLAEQETLYTRSKEEWEREYRQWKHIVQREKHAAENRLSAAVTALQEGIALLDCEARDIHVESTTAQRAYADAVSASEKELDALKRREDELESRHEEMRQALRRLEEQSEKVAKEWTRLREERSAVNAKRESLREDESKLQQMLTALKLVRAQVDGMRSQTIATSERNRALKHQLAFSKASLQHVPVPVSAGSKETRPTRTAKMSHSRGHRLPLKVLQELRHQLQTLPTINLDADTGSLNYCPADVPRLPDAARAAPPLHGTPAAVTPPQPGASLARPRPDERRAAGRGGTSASAVTPLSHTPASHRAAHVDPYAGHPARHASSQPLTEYSSSSLLTGTDWSPGNTFTNLVNFTDNDTTSQSFRTF